MIRSLNWTAIEPDEPFVVSRLIRSDYLHREFPVLVARVKQAKRQRERWGGTVARPSPMPQPRRGLMALFGRG